MAMTGLDGLYNSIQKATGFSVGQSTKDAISALTDGQRMKLYDDVRAGSIPKDDMGLFDVKAWEKANPQESASVAKQEGNSEAKKAAVDRGTQVLLDAFDRLAEMNCHKKVGVTFGTLRNDQKVKNALDNPAVNIRLAVKGGHFVTPAKDLRVGQEEDAWIYKPEE
eukprot:NODE_1498_length_835_cov_123.522599_g1450_i0.p1 GENE.NODE_1498_length_835_cov_123.522599_g1450_i0~~NODE_1498_length_835_cov_123.522599_g1450_i0.p1  ORF type:complete len:195 (-),score=73.85 NODE_1498_length_835_cov_123.522599_g1450_i0:250-747(-)